MIRDRAVRRRISALAIPPAYVDVWICLHPNGYLQATGRDTRGRKQYRYHPRWRELRDATKFDHLREFGSALPRIRREVNALLADGPAPTRECVLAALVRLLDTTWLRIGNAEYLRANGSFGLSTLRKRHAVARDNDIQLSFIGKSGVPQRAHLTDRRVARIVRRCQDIPGQFLFRYLDAEGAAHAIDSADVNGWLAQISGLHITAKDFRTWHASVRALALLRAHQQAARETAREPAQENVQENVQEKAQENTAEPVSAKAVVAEVARGLGNSPAVCRKSYIHPFVLALIDGEAEAALTRNAPASKGGGRRTRSGSRSKRGLTVAERALLDLLASAGARGRRKSTPPCTGHGDCHTGVRTCNANPHTDFTLNFRRTK